MTTGCFQSGPKGGRSAVEAVQAIERSKRPPTCKRSFSSKLTVQNGVSTLAPTALGPSRRRGLPRFFLHLVLKGERRPDPEGSELPDQESAVLEAILAAKDKMAEVLSEGKPLIRDAWFEVASEDGTVLATVTFAAAADYG
jgi:hypothetical protein